MKFCAIRVEFGTKYVHKNVMINFDFHENQCNKSLAVGKHVHGIKITCVLSNSMTFWK
jgi:hypothetical protein